MLLRQRDRGRLQARIVVAAAREVEQIIAFVHEHPGRADRPIILRAVLRGSVPGLYHDCGVGALWRLLVIAEPLSPDHGAAGRDRGLLVLRREDIGTDLAPKRLEALERFKFGV